MNNEWIKLEDKLPPVNIEFFGFITDDIIEGFKQNLQDNGIEVPEILSTNPDVFVCTFNGGNFLCMLYCNLHKMWHPMIISDIPYWRFKVDPPIFNVVDKNGNIETLKKD